jgi:hypothetical protein
LYNELINNNTKNLINDKLIGIKITINNCKIDINDSNSNKAALLFKDKESTISFRTSTMKMLNINNSDILESLQSFQLQYTTKLDASSEHNLNFSVTPIIKLFDEACY